MSQLTVVPGQPRLVTRFKLKEAAALMAHRKKKIPAQLVEDEGYQLRHERVAGVDIAKDKGDVSVRLPPAGEGGRRRSRVEENVPRGDSSHAAARRRGRAGRDGEHVRLLEDLVLLIRN